ncbi:hypothetical protein A6A04_10120 [Paramagnetospirillum marisnigri]|uniref:Response regulatory domain-containing protein n=1 Tax=Paramagnetospirillum marisnigri TaxID=1285242 RepID=A0A178M451_9PROT|nr:SpoIIE family protein phosphatase [Paramagnetospirillum marisnigri]OAN43040.1 hypothetical protein A6A04_10120 [Paramagnetospirillum marisnigri]
MNLEDLLVLIVEDNAVNQRLLATIVQSIGVSRIETAFNGREGLEAIARAKPDLVLLDVMMPVMDGYEMCRRLRIEHGQTDLPVLFVTALNNPESRAACFDAGGTDMVSKPLNIAEVTARLRVHLQNRILLAGLQAYRTRMSEEVDLARSTQEALHPNQRQLDLIAERTGVTVCGSIETSSELGGDFWTVYETHRGDLGILVADFTGHGVAASFNTVRLHALMARRPWELHGPGELLEFLNHELKRLLQPGQFAAALACELTPGTGALTCAGAMTPQPLVMRANGSIEGIEVSGPPLGAFMNATYGLESMVLEPGETLLAYSDALVESVDHAHQPVVDQPTLLDWMREIGPAGDLVGGVWSRFHQRLPGRPPDDLTLVTLRRGA